mgnify:CR=1 FL=1
MKNNNELGIYIHIPFCMQKCIYCDFLSAPAGDAVKYAYTKALINEIRNTADGQVKDKITSIFFGGGTPSVLPDGCIADILAAVRDCFDVLDDAEITMECNPGTVNESRLSEYRAAGVNRLSFGLQSADNNELKMLGRIHTFEQFEESFRLARAAGFNNINVDLIMGLPGEDEAMIHHTLDEVKKLAPTSLTVHSLAIKRAAALNIWRDKYQAYALNNTDEIIDAAAACAADMGMEPYYMYRQKNMAGNFENVGYSVPGLECIYNILIMEEKQSIVALGAGASTKIVMPQDDGSVRIERIENVKSVKDYIERIDEMIERKNGDVFNYLVNN